MLCAINYPVIILSFEWEVMKWQQLLLCPKKV